jgi:D-alanyl-D-alanine carboxypeptidase (penicillin-binding protein 5/6)
MRLAVSFRAGLIGAGLAALSIVLLPANGHAIESEAPRALVIEAANGAVLFSQNADEPFEAGNFTKLVTAATVFAALDAGDLRGDQLLRITEHAWRTGGAPARTTTMFAEINSEVAVDDLVSGLLVHYANDAAIALAEGLSGSEAAFAERMNAVAAEAGMSASSFADPTGLDPAAATVTLGDVSRIVDMLRLRYPAGYARYATPEFEWNGILQTSKTSILRTIPGAEGLILAQTPEAGYGAAASAVRDGRRVVVLVSGLASDREREAELKRLFDAAYAEYATVRVASAGVAIGTVRVFGGASARVEVAGSADIYATLPHADRSSVAGEIVYSGPVAAPVRAGDEVARLEITAGGQVIQSVPLVAVADVGRGTIRQRAEDGLFELAFGWW